MKTIKTSELSGAALDWAVAKCEGYRTEKGFPDWLILRGKHLGINAPSPAPPFSTDWLWGGPILEREAHNLFKHNGGTEWCCACNVPLDGYTAIVVADGPTPLVAAMRCFCCSKLGDEVEVPDELL